MVTQAAAQINADTGIPNTELCPKALNDLMLTGTGLAFAICIANPRDTPSMPKVTRKGGIFVRETKRPLMSPIQFPRAIPPSTPGKSPYDFMIVAVVIEVRATTDP